MGVGERVVKSRDESGPTGRASLSIISLLTCASITPSALPSRTRSNTSVAEGPGGTASSGESGVKDGRSEGATPVSIVLVF